jgi:plasmid maintenance system killer protein
MIIKYKDGKEQKFYESEKLLVAKYGAAMAKRINMRLEEIMAAENPYQLPKSARFHEHKGNRKGLFSIDLIQPFRLIIKPMRDYANWNEITIVKIYEIIDPH